MQIDISNDLLFEACALVYSRWSKTYDALKAVKSETDDGSKDWNLFHKARLDHATKAESEWRSRKDEAGRLSSLAIA